MHQLAFTNNTTTEGIKYAGSKLNLLPYILQLARQVEAHTVFDAFGGTTRVSQAFAKSGYRVLCNDLAVWTEVFGTCYLLNHKPPKAYQPLIEHLNSVQPKDGWFTQHYGGNQNRGCAIQQDGLKKPWQLHNTRKLDGIRQEIENLHLDKIDKAVAITSLILALDQVDNTMGHYVAYLKDWSPRSYRQLTLKVPATFIAYEQHEVFRANVFDLLPQVKVDLAYLDPPYGSNNDKMPPSRVRYAAYYHLWTSICLFDQPQVFGKVHRRQDSADSVAASVFEEFRKDNQGKYIVVQVIERLIKEVQARWIILSYSSGGRATATELDDLLRRHGEVRDVLKIDYKKNVMAGMKWTNKWLRDIEQSNLEFLFLIEK